MQSIPVKAHQLFWGPALPPWVGASGAGGGVEHRVPGKVFPSLATQDSAEARKASRSFQLGIGLCSSAGKKRWGGRHVRAALGMS